MLSVGSSPILGRMRDLLQPSCIEVSKMHSTIKTHPQKINPAPDNFFAQRPVGFTEAEAASYLGLKVYTLRKWRREGSGPEYIRCGARLIRYMQADIDFWLNQRKFQSIAHELSSASKG